MRAYAKEVVWDWGVYLVVGRRHYPIAWFRWFGAKAKAHELAQKINEALFDAEREETND